MPNSQYYIKKMALPQSLSADWFRDNLTLICTRLKKDTKARIALLSIPPIGENLDHSAYKQSAFYSKIIESAAIKENIT